MSKEKFDFKRFDLKKIDIEVEKKDEVEIWPFSVIYIILSLINSTLLTADMIPLRLKRPVPKWWLASPFPWKYV
jgi:hypothetical protein